MTKKSPHLSVKPDVMKWLRESSGWTIDEVSKNIGISANRILEWENGEFQPTYLEIVKLAKAYKRPTAAFFLPSPEPEPPFPHDFRKLPGEVTGFSRDTIQIIRKAQYSKLISKELTENLDLSLEAEVKHTVLKDNPEEIADRERYNFNLTLENQLHWKMPRDGYNLLRDIIESKNIRVFQFKADIHELRGFSLLDSKPYVINVNSKDIYEARIFTLLHEYGHVLLNIPALCTPDNPISIDEHGAKIEKWCNTFAGAFLLPKESISNDFNRYGITDYWKIAKRYRVSKSATLTRLVSLKMISQDEYYKQIDILKREEEEEAEKEAQKEEEEESTGPFGIKQTVKVKNEMGNGYISLVLKNSEKGLITYSRALDYLKIKSHSLRELMKH